MQRIDEAFATGKPVFMCDFSPPRGGSEGWLSGAEHLKGAFIDVGYNPGRAVRIDSASTAEAAHRHTGADVVFNLSPRDMNKLAIESYLVGADLRGLRNVLVVQGDPLSARDTFSAVYDYNATGLIEAITRLNAGEDHRGSKLQSPTQFCVGAGIDLGKDLDAEIALVRRKVETGTHFFVSQPVFEATRIVEFLERYTEMNGAPLNRPVLWGLQILIQGGVIFSSVPQLARDQLEAGRDGAEIALEAYQSFRAAGVRGFFLVGPILKGGGHNYAAAGRFVRSTQTLT